MANDPIPLRKAEPPEDALDINSLWLDPALGDGLVDVHFHLVPVGKPKTFFRVNPDPAYRRLTEIYTHKVEGQIDEQNFISASPCRARSMRRGAAPWLPAFIAMDRRASGR
jgi:hypothetical protein